MQADCERNACHPALRPFSPRAPVDRIVKRSRQSSESARRSRERSFDEPLVTLLSVIKLMGRWRSETLYERELEVRGAGDVRVLGDWQALCRLDKRLWIVVIKAWAWAEEISCSIAYSFRRIILHSLKGLPSLFVE